MASACQDLGRPSFAGVCGEVLVEVELRPWRLARGEDVYWQRVVVEAVQSAMSTYQKVLYDGEAYKSGT